jgi:hypothetical protein
MAEEERRRILFEINNGDWSEEERREILLDIETYVQGSVNQRQRKEQQEERLRLIELLQDHSRYGRVPVVFPDADDPLASSVAIINVAEESEDEDEISDNSESEDETDDDEEEDEMDDVEEDETDDLEEEDEMDDGDDDNPLASSDISI